MNKPDESDLALRAALRRLPRSVQPERDLWAGIQREISAAPAASLAGAQAKPRRGIGMPWAIAASVASLGVGVFLTLAMLHGRAPVQQAAVPPAAMAAEFSFVPASTDAVRAKLRQSCAAQLANLPAATRDKVVQDLMLIKNAVADIQTALAKDPGNALLQDLLVTTYQNELDTLANVQALASSAHSEVSI